VPEAAKGEGGKGIGYGRGNGMEGGKGWTEGEEGKAEEEGRGKGDTRHGEGTPTNKPGYGRGLMLS